eukprot:SAG31_NODE_3262_length_4482_cov_8.132101_2_plen_332_part_00
MLIPSDGYGCPNLLMRGAASLGCNSSFRGPVPLSMHAADNVAMGSAQRHTLSPTTARLSCIGMTVLFVGLLYAVPASIRRSPRDSPTHIQARSISVTVTTVLSCLAARALLGSVLSAQEASSWAWIGIAPQGLGAASVLPLLLTCTLFAMPLLTSALELAQIATTLQEKSPLLSRATALRAAIVHELQMRTGAADANWWPAFRNLFFGPLTEEIVFRGCMLPLLLVAGRGALGSCIECPLVFGLAHLHHAYERVAAGTHSLRQSVIVAMVQNIYTALFGSYACFVLLRTGHLWAAFVSHAFCNLMGLPDMSFLQPRGSGGLSFLHPYRFMV